MVALGRSSGGCRHQGLDADMRHLSPLVQRKSVR